MEKDDRELAVCVLLASYEQANNYLRDTSRRIEEHIKFYLTATTALIGAIAYAFTTGTTAPFTKPVLALGTFALCGFGVITFRRLISIKSQATQHTAWLKGVEYSLNRIAFGDQISIKRPQVPQTPSGPFSKAVIFILFTFGVYNSIIFAVCASVSANVASDFLTLRSPLFGTSDTIVFGLIGLVAFAVSLVLHQRELTKGWKQAFADYAEVLRYAIMTPPEKE
jgi:hypothetical protein